MSNPTVIRAAFLSLKKEFRDASSRFPLLGHALIIAPSKTEPLPHAPPLGRTAFVRRPVETPSYKYFPRRTGTWFDSPFPTVLTFIKTNEHCKAFLFHDWYTVPGMMQFDAAKEAYSAFLQLALRSGLLVARMFESNWLPPLDCPIGRVIDDEQRWLTTVYELLGTNWLQWCPANIGAGPLVPARRSIPPQVFQDPRNRRERHDSLALRLLDDVNSASSQAADMLAGFLVDGNLSQGEPAAMESVPLVMVSEVPRWDEERSELSFLGETARVRPVAKRLRAILGAFEEEGWPYRIDCPLPGEPGHDQNRRSAVRDLNKKLPSVLRFEADGTCEGITWSKVSQLSRTSNASNTQAP